MTNCPLVFVLDVDGVMTDGSFLCGVDGKFAKVFGPDDHDALCLLQTYMEIVFVTGDHRGYAISERRVVADMKMRLELVSTIDRLSWIGSRWDTRDVVYMGDGIFDGCVFQGVGYSIAAAGALEPTRRLATYVTERHGGDRAVAEAALHLLDRFFTGFDARTSLPDVALHAIREANGMPLRKRLLNEYIRAFATKDIARIESLFSDNIALQDWEVSAQGKSNVLALYESIFAASENIVITLTALHEKQDGLLAELIIDLEGVGSFLVMDALEFDDDQRICRINAFKGATISSVGMR